MNSIEDLLTIALPVYNRTNYIRKALDSAVNQTVRCRILLIDNHSPHDEFRKILDSYDHPYKKYYRTEETVPQDANFNNCFTQAETPWVTILHDDDMLHCQFVEMAQKILKRYSQDIGGFAVKCFVGEEEWENVDKIVELTDKANVVNEPFFYFKQLTPFPGVLLNTNLALKLGGFHADLHPIADLDFWYRYSKASKMLLVNQVLAYYRISRDQSTNHLIDRMINNVYKYRLNLIKKGPYNNPLTRLALEDSRINNIKFFQRTYNNFVLEEEKIYKLDKLKKAKMLFRFTPLLKIVQKYSRKISLRPA